MSCAKHAVLSLTRSWQSTFVQDQTAETTINVTDEGWHVAHGLPPLPPRHCPLPPVHWAHGLEGPFTDQMPIVMSQVTHVDPDFDSWFLSCWVTLTMPFNMTVWHGHWLKCTSMSKIWNSTNVIIKSRNDRIQVTTFRSCCSLSTMVSSKFTSWINLKNNVLIILILSFILMVIKSLYGGTLWAPVHLLVYTFVTLFGGCWDTYTLWTPTCSWHSPQQVTLSTKPAVTSA